MRYILLLTILLGISLMGCKKWRCNYPYNFMRVVKNDDTVSFYYIGKEENYISVKQQYLSQGYILVYEETNTANNNPEIPENKYELKAMEQNGAKCYQE